MAEYMPNFGVDHGVTDYADGHYLSTGGFKEEAAKKAKANFKLAKKKVENAKADAKARKSEHAARQERQKKHAAAQSFRDRDHNAERGVLDIPNMKNPGAKKEGNRRTEEHMPTHTRNGLRNGLPNTEMEEYIKRQSKHHTPLKEKAEMAFPIAGLPVDKGAWRRKMNQQLEILAKNKELNNRYLYWSYVTDAPKSSLRSPCEGVTWNPLIPLNFANVHTRLTSDLERSGAKVYSRNTTKEAKPLTCHLVYKHCMAFLYKVLDKQDFADELFQCDYAALKNLPTPATHDERQQLSFYPVVWAMYLDGLYQSNDASRVYEDMFYQYPIALAKLDQNSTYSHAKHGAGGSIAQAYENGKLEMHTCQREVNTIGKAFLPENIKIFMMWARWSHATTAISHAYYRKGDSAGTAAAPTGRNDGAEMPMDKHHELMHLLYTHCFKFLDGAKDLEQQHSEAKPEHTSGSVARVPGGPSQTAGEERAVVGPNPSDQLDPTRGRAALDPTVPEFPSLVRSVENGLTSPYAPNI